MARNYDTAVGASVVSTAGNATLSVTDPSTTATGHLVNGTFALPSALQVRAANAANPNPAYAPLSETANTPLEHPQLRRPDRGRGHRHDRLPPGDRRHRHAACR